MRFILFIYSLILLTSCSSSSEIQPEETVQTNNKISFQHEEDIDLMKLSKGLLQFNYSIHDDSKIDESKMDVTFTCRDFKNEEVRINNGIETSPLNSGVYYVKVVVKEKSKKIKAQNPQNESKKLRLPSINLKKPVLLVDGTIIVRSGYITEINVLLK
ncbi:hypothetical protein [Flammeovirga kamogawensis]|uniref:Lipoprotein n=1 Tax=Flammeovirga kamogawensis TaxID=373891 RepID=A0ABX8GQX3_9BACT|nr:hypothetical protein [Flammeovirga kamogawensis]MBB6463182.1 hypothetical protein [Flammeovirga kamogawensis]QWG05964.1 hypothetical protein KM029_11355 [Flammeovirga kamogawensis]TRX67791.1 hypothetical protein EO216_06365 [Flammeovirga kamogawensis]